jgi:outer membrane protein assembly factor BamB
MSSNSERWPRRGLQALACGLVLVLLAATVGCRSRDHAPSRRERAEKRARAAANEAAPGAPSAQDVEALRALPYVHWTAGADRSLRGVVRHDRGRAWQGVNLYTNDADEAYLMDMDGGRVHTWRIPPTPQQHCERAELLDGGRLAVICVNDALFVLDSRSNVLLEHRAKVHHDLAALADGTLIVADKKIHPYRWRMVYFDGLSWLRPDGSARRTWSTWQHRETLQALHPPSALDQPGEWWKLLSRSYDYYHLNTVESLRATALGERDRRFRAGNLLLCLRHPGLVLVIDQDSGEPVWSWGPGELDGPHQPTLLDNGHLLVFDNGTGRTYSRVIELDPVTLDIAWEYRADPPERFHSKWRGSSQRLPNGNTLICESDSGRVFEVTAAGETVWEFWNPELDGDRRKGIYRFQRLDRARVAWAFERSVAGRSETKR